LSSICAETVERCVDLTCAQRSGGQKHRLAVERAVVGRRIDARDDAAALLDHHDAVGVAEVISRTGELLANALVATEVVGHLVALGGLLHLLGDRLSCVTMSS
jgi:ABC-type transport system involved in cytochrome bd biosynthesis fused ATPase/permease subunit